MKNVSIYGKKWLDIVFEGKNKDYGAYQLRQETEKTSLFALFFGISFLASFVFILSSFAERTIPIPVIEEPAVDIIPVDLEPLPVLPETKVVEPPKATPPTTEKQIPSGPMVVVETNRATPDIPTNEELPQSVPTPNGNPNGTSPATTENTSETAGGIGSNPAAPTGPLSTKELDRLPTFPGGIKRFYEYVGTNFDGNNVEENQTVRINVSFVIEKNGTLTDIKVIENTSPAISKEAIRVLKSLKTKWTPGYKDGQAVRTYFTLPIAVTI